MSSRMDHDGYGKAPRSRYERPQGTRPAPYDPVKDKQRTTDGDQEVMLETPANSYKVSSQTDVRELASTITQSCMSGDIPALLTIGCQSINQAVKGIAVAAGELRQYGDLTFQPAFRHTNRTKPFIAFYLARQRPQKQDDSAEVVELTATGNQKIVSLAGAVAAKVREGKRTQIVAVGAEAVTNAVLAVGNARLFLEQNGMDIKVTPEFTKVTKQNSTLNAVKLNIIPEKIA